MEQQAAPNASASERATLLCVDDTVTSLEAMRRVLGSHYRVLVASSAKEALEALHREPVDLVLMDVQMPEVDGFETCRRILALPRYEHLPIIFVTGSEDDEDERRCFRAGGVDFVTKPLRPATLLARVGTHLALYEHQRELDGLVVKRTLELQQTRMQIIRRLGRAAEYKDNETGNHVVRMSYYCRRIAQAAGRSEAEAELLFLVAPMHDIGKIGIPESILLKPGKLTPEEWGVMKTHPSIGAEIIGDDPNELLRCAHDVALYHHERWDGAGYPKGLRGGDIPWTGRIVAVADVLDALMSVRPYKRAWTFEEASEEIQKCSGSQFDPDAVKAFLAVGKDCREIAERYSEQKGAMGDSDLRRRAPASGE
ncbi:MAG TPA: HD domain-containing phosphohydrolase [Myxococcales bacterium]